MSMDRCFYCTESVDSDEDLECYEEGSDKCTCLTCREFSRKELSEEPRELLRNQKLSDEDLDRKAFERERAQDINRHK